MDLSMLSGPIIGAVIGYGTNWIAIKMLFRPLKPIKIGKFTLPFTPGIIPKRKDKLAKAIGESVGNNLFTKNDIQEMLLSDEMEKIVVDGILKGLSSDKKVKECLLEMLDKSQYNQGREKLKLVISKKIKDGLIEIGVSDLIVTEGEKAIREKVKASMLRMFVTDDLIHSIVEPMGTEIGKYIETQGEDRILPVVESEISALENKELKELSENMQKAEIEKIICEIYRKIVCDYFSNIIEKLDIAGVVENKINQMEVLELEKLILSIMKKELGAIVNLGALIGVILGSLNMVL